MRLAAASRRRRSLSLIPLIDVMLVLLFFFMLAGATVQYGRTRVEFTLPAGSAAGPAGKPAKVQEAFVLANGYIRINGSDYNVPGAIPVLRELPVGIDLKLIPAPGLPLQTLLQLWERLRAEGIRSRLGEARAAPATAAATP